MKTTFYSHANKTHFHNKGLALNLKVFESIWNWEMAYPYSFIYFSLSFHLFILLCFMHVFNLRVKFFENVYTCIETEIIKS